MIYWFFYSLAGKHMPFSLLQISLFWQEQFFLHSFPKWLWSHPVNFFQIINIYKESTIDKSMELSDSQTWYISTSIHISIYLQCIFLSVYIFHLLLSHLLPIHPALQSQTPEEELQLNEFSATHSQDLAQSGPKV